jgi:fatty-acid desaturase
MTGSNFMIIFELIVGGYMLYSAITGRGKLYVNDNIVKDKKEEYFKLLRLFFAVAGPLLLLEALFDYLNLRVLSYISLGIMLVGMVFILIKTQKITVPREAKHKS